MVDQGLNVGIVVGVITPCGSENYSYGKTVLSGDQAVDENTIFETVSIGKVFTALLLADMFSRGTQLTYNHLARRRFLIKPMRRIGYVSEVRGGSTVA